MQDKVELVENRSVEKLQMDITEQIRRYFNQAHRLRDIHYSTLSSIEYYDDGYGGTDEVTQIKYSALLWFVKE